MLIACRRILRRAQHRRPRRSGWHAPGHRLLTAPEAVRIVLIGWTVTTVRWLALPTVVVLLMWPWSPPVECMRASWSQGWMRHAPRAGTLASGG